MMDEYTKSSGEGQMRADGAVPYLILTILRSMVSSPTVTRKK
jgi:hypothetical protein